MTGGTVEGVSQHDLTSSPLRTVAETAQTAATALMAMAGMAVCADGWAAGTCGDRHARMLAPDACLVAIAPAIANPYLNVAIGMAADTVGVAGGAEQHVRGNFVLCSCMDDAELVEEDLRLQRCTNPHQRRLLGVYGDIIHQNDDGTHFDSGIGVTEDAKWQRLVYLRVAACHLQLYDFPNS